MRITQGDVTPAPTSSSGTERDMIGLQVETETLRLLAFAQSSTTRYNLLFNSSLWLRRPANSLQPFQFDYDYILVQIAHTNRISESHTIVHRADLYCPKVDVDWYNG